MTNFQNSLSKMKQKTAPRQKKRKKKKKVKKMIGGVF